MSTTTNQTINGGAEATISLSGATSMSISLIEGDELRYSFTSGQVGHRATEEDTLVGIAEDIYIYNDTPRSIKIAVTKFGV